ncbi:iron complex transport system ATP-binding protein [Constrictibacter sp. MBR-5]|jgi:iron complex transport system ATP-binding protein|uniref:ABC transporter ATP-binding protein n=1 Tax=Constrictibacter sp. MBR-5 TaxID=3156467 RepID=UPI00339895F4
MSVLATEGLSKALGGRQVLRDVSLSLAAGSVVGLLGPNGAGKSTLLRLLVGLLEPDGGRITLDGIPLDAVPARERARRIAYLPQHGVVHWELSVEAVVGLGRIPHQGAPSIFSGDRIAPADRAAIDAAMRLTDVSAFAERPLGTLSGGERARVLLARALAGTPRVLLADEPVAGLDPAHALDAMVRLRGVAANGTLVVVVLHDLAMAGRFCDRIVLLHEGCIHADGVPADVLTAAALARVYGVTAVCGTNEGMPYVLPWAKVGEGHHA